MIKTLALEKFTAFDKIQIEFSPGINVIVGENGTGKTHLMKAAYALSTPSRGKNGREPGELITEKFLGVFMPDDHRLNELARRGPSGHTRMVINLQEATEEKTIEASFYLGSSKVIKIENEEECKLSNSVPVFIPTKEVLSFYKGFVSLYDHRQIAFDATYRDICQALDLPEARTDVLEEKAKWALNSIEEICGGKFIFRGGIVKFKQSAKEEFAVNLIAEGFRKLGMLYRLIENQSIDPGISGPLFIDESEANLNPRLLKVLVAILLDLSRRGQQVFLATHDYVLLKEIDLQKRAGDGISFHSLYRDSKTEEISAESTNSYLKIHPNVIADTFGSLMDRDIQKSMGGLGK